MANVDEFIAEKLFDWKWIAFKGKPVRGTPGYPEDCVVRRFVSPALLSNERWIKHFEEIGGFTDATGEEPLAYCYCSSNGPEIVPPFAEFLSNAREIQQTEGWSDIEAVVWAMIDGEPNGDE